MLAPFGLDGNLTAASQVDGVRAAPAPRAALARQGPGGEAPPSGWLVLVLVPPALPAVRVGAHVCLRAGLGEEQAWQGPSCLETAARTLGQSWQRGLRGRCAGRCCSFMSFAARQGAIKSTPVWWETFYKEKTQPPVLV